MAKKRNKNKNRIEAKSENKVLHGLAGSLEEAFSEDVSEIEQDDVIVVDVPERKHKGIAKKVAYFLVGLLVIVFAVVGVVNTVIAASGAINRMANQTDLKEEFALYLYPIVATDPPSFEDASTLTQSTIIKAAVSRILLTGDTSNYETDTGVMYIPEFDVETAAKNIFGNSIEVTHQTVGHVQDLATYNSEKKVYIVADTNRVPNYYPQVSKIENVGETYTLTVDYYPPTVSIPGLVTDHVSSKSMTYVITKSGDKKTIASIALDKVSREEG